MIGINFFGELFNFIDSDQFSLRPILIILHTAFMLSFAWEDSG
jgi:hypothetical protein